MDFLTLVWVALAAYIIGSFPTGAIVARCYRNVDLTRVGSTRTGATNTGRVLGMGAGLVVFAVDFGKGALAVWLAQAIVGSVAAVGVAGFASVVGHTKSAFLKGRGGRGVLTGLGGLSVAAPFVFVPACLTGCIVSVLTRYVSLGSIAGSVMAIVVGFVTFAVGGLAPELYAYAVAAPLFIIWAHLDNIRRLFDRTERRIGQRESTTSAP